MKRVIFIGRHSSGENNDVQILAHSVAGQTNGLEVDYGFLENASLAISTDSIQAHILSDGKLLDIAGYEAIILVGWSHDKMYSDLAAAIARFAANKKITVWNSELTSARSMTKLSQMVIGALAKLPVPKTAFSMNSQELKRLIEEKLSYPIILKDAQASRGRRNYLLKSKTELEDLLKKSGNTYFLAQEYIQNDGSDLRILIAGGQPALCLKRTGSSDSHLNNISTGARAELISLEDLSNELKAASRKVAEVFKRELSGVDFIKSQQSGEYVFLEINLTPQIVNGVFVEEKVKAISTALTSAKEEDQS